MKILPLKIDFFIKDILNSNNVSSLLYGEEYGLKCLYADQITRQLFKDEYNSYSYDGAQIDKDPSIIYSEVANQDLMGTPKIIIIKNITVKTAAIIENIIASENLSLDNYLIVIASELNAKSSLRKLYESNDKLAAIACYKDSEAVIKGIIVNYFQDKNITYENEVLNLIAMLVGSDRLILLAELEKIDLFLGNERFLTYNAASKILNEFYHVSSENFIDNFFACKKEDAYKDLQMMKDDNIGFMTILRQMLSHLHKIRVMKHEIENNNSSVQEQIKLHHIFFNRANAFTSHLKRWNSSRLAKIEKMLFTIELNGKLYGEDAAISSLNYLISKLPQ